MASCAQPSVGATNPLKNAVLSSVRRLANSLALVLPSPAEQISPTRLRGILVLFEVSRDATPLTAAAYHSLAQNPCVKETDFHDIFKVLCKVLSRFSAAGRAMLIAYYASVYTVVRVPFVFQPCLAETGCRFSGSV